MSMQSHAGYHDRFAFEFDDLKFNRQFKFSASKYNYMTRTAHFIARTQWRHFQEILVGELACRAVK